MNIKQIPHGQLYNQIQNQIQNNIIQELDEIEKRKITEELNAGKSRMIMNIICYIFLILGTLAIYVSIGVDKVTFGRLAIKSKLIKKVTAIGLAIVWTIFLIAESFKLNMTLEN